MGDCGPAATSSGTAILVHPAAAGVFSFVLATHGMLVDRCTGGRSRRGGPLKLANTCCQLPCLQHIAVPGAVSCSPELLNCFAPRTRSRGADCPRCCERTTPAPSRHTSSHTVSTPQAPSRASALTPVRCSCWQAVGASWQRRARTSTSKMAAADLATPALGCTLESLNCDVLAQLLLRCTARDVAAAICCSRRLRALAADEERIWRALCERIEPGIDAGAWLQPSGPASYR